MARSCIHHNPYSVGISVRPPGMKARGQQRRSQEQEEAQPTDKGAVWSKAELDAAMTTLWVKAGVGTDTRNKSLCSFPW